MNVFIDIEANGLENPDQVWLIVCKELDTGKWEIFRNVTSNPHEKERFQAYARNVTRFIGHHIIGYDLPVLAVLDVLVGFDIAGKAVDTLIVSKLVNYSREGGHSVESYGEEFGVPKKEFYQFTDKSLFNCHSELFRKMEDYCIRDVELNELIYKKHEAVINDPSWHSAIDTEQRFQLIVNQLHYTGFAFNTEKATKLLEKVTEELGGLDARILEAFPARTELVKEYTPKCTKHGTISKTSVPRGEDDLSAYQEGATFSRFRWVQFNPSSHKQLIEVLAGAGWQPVDRTTTHNRYRDGDPVVLDRLQKYGWKINENNLATLPAKAPEPARLLAKRILLESRRRTLTEWLGLVNASTGRIHGRFYGIGAWTHRMAHQQPNTANIPNEFDTAGKVKLLGKEMRQLWRAPKKRLLVGVDAEGIQLRIFAHYIDDKEFTYALVSGRKDDKTDPHSLNQRILGGVCKSRAAAKRFIYALLLGAGQRKLQEILECSESECKEALDRLLLRYTGFALLKKEVIPEDAKRGFFVGLDGRRVLIPGLDVGERRHLCMSGYLQNGEAVVMKRATLKWHDKLKEYDACLVNFVHDEWQTECPNNVDIALKIAKMQADSLVEVGKDLKLKCPLAGSYWNDDHKDWTVGTNWYQTH